MKLADPLPLVELRPATSVVVPSRGSSCERRSTWPGCIGNTGSFQSNVWSVLFADGMTDNLDADAERVFVATLAEPAK